MRLTGIISVLFFIACFMALNAMVWATATIYGQTIGLTSMYLIFGITTVFSVFFTAQVWEDLIMNWDKENNCKP